MEKLVYPSISIVIASCGRRSLQATLDSAIPQLANNDEILVCVNNDSPWGHNARNRIQRIARGDVLIFMDDDDTYRPDALAQVRKAFAGIPDAVHIFRMQYPDGRILWNDRRVAEANVSTQMVAVPGRYMGKWGSRYAGDFDFIATSVSSSERPAVFQDAIICDVGHN